MIKGPEKKWEEPLKLGFVYFREKGKGSYDKILKITNDQGNTGQILLSCLRIKTR